MENTTKLPYEAPALTVVGSVAELTNAAQIFNSNDNIVITGTNGQLGGVSR